MGGRPAQPLESPAGWIRSGDYPVQSVSGLEEGAVTYELAVDPSGKVRGCRIIGSSGYPLLDDATCRVLVERARFRPALDGDGRAVESRFAGRVRWVLPIQHLPLPRRQAVVMSFIVEPDGSRSDCRVDYAQNEFGPGGISGSMPCGAGRFDEPFRDADGKPVRRKVTRTVVTTIEEVAEPKADGQEKP